ncbi:MAG TPA: hypothetical protein VFB06_20500 [Streptosporangiaceae bacterium]|nr:hypothetical protein [Streptosporangiaceae bacterium]
MRPASGRGSGRGGGGGGKHRIPQVPFIARPARRIELFGLLVGLSAGCVAVAVWIAVFRVAGYHQGAGGQAGSSAQAAATSSPPVDARAGAGPDAAALDSEWEAYSDRSTCADWAGGDGVAAIRLSSSQLAWFFSDTDLGPAGPQAGFSRSSGFLHNSVVVQTLAGSGSTFVTMTGGGACNVPGRPLGPPTAIIHPPSGSYGRYWAADGLLTGGSVVKFYNRYAPGAFPFTPQGTVIASFPVSQLSAAGLGPAYGAVARPSVTAVPSYVPPAGGTPIIWGASVLQVGGTAYVYGTQAPASPTGPNQLYLARAPVSRLTQFASWQFYAGNGQWASGQQGAQPVLPPGSTLGVPSGFSVVNIAHRYWLIETGVVPGSQYIDAFPAATPWGPFDQADGLVLYKNPEIGLDAAHDYRIMYEARAELALSSSSTLVISFNVNSEAVTTGCVPMSALTNTVTQPKFITVPTRDFAVSGGGLAAGVLAGPSDYPRIVPSDPGQWFNSYALPGGCPPVPALATVRAQPGSGKVTLTWPDAGLGVRYQVYLLGPGAQEYSPVTTVRSDGVVLSGLRAGSYQARVVPANLQHTTGQGAQTSFTVG